MTGGYAAVYVCVCVFARIAVHWHCGCVLRVLSKIELQNKINAIQSFVHSPHIWMGTGHTHTQNMYTQMQAIPIKI